MSGISTASCRSLNPYRVTIFLNRFWSPGGKKYLHYICTTIGTTIQYIQLYNYIQLYKTVYNYIQLYTTVYNYIQLYTTIYNYIQLYTTIYNYTIVYTIVYSI